MLDRSTDPLNRPFAWSHSRLNSFETCGLRHLEVDLLKNYIEGPSPERDYGSNLHKALEIACRDGTPMPPEFHEYQSVADKVRAMPGDKTYEQKFGITREFEPCDFFARDVYLRVVSDVFVRDMEHDRAAIVDYKTGKIKPDPLQLQLNAAVVFLWYKNVKTVETAYWWICKGGGLSKYTFTRDMLPKLWGILLPRVNRYQKAYENRHFIPNPSGLCRKYCPVTSCVFHGKGGLTTC